jgi:hypothetical protein
LPSSAHRRNIAPGRAVNVSTAAIKPILSWRNEHATREHRRNKSILQRIIEALAAASAWRNSSGGRRLENIRQLVAEVSTSGGFPDTVDNPEIVPLWKVIHVAGTNGKFSLRHD